MLLKYITSKKYSRKVQSS